MFARPPSKQDLEQMQALGLSPDDYASSDAEVWPENVRAFQLFADLQTQWRVGMGGATGLDYNTLFHKMDRMGLEPDEYELLEDDVRTMEFAALDAMANKD